MDQLTSPESARAEQRSARSIPRPRPRTLPRRPMARPSAGGLAWQAMDDAIQSDLRGHPPKSESSLPARMVALLHESGGNPMLSDLVEVLEADPRTSAISRELRDLEAPETDLPLVLQCLADHAEATGAVETIAPVVAMLSLRSVPSLIHSETLEDLLHQLSQASTEMVSKNGVEALATMPHILGVIDHHARRNGLPDTELPSAILRITQQVASDPRVVTRILRQPHKRSSESPSVEAIPAKASEEKLLIDRPAEITIRYLD